MRIRLLAIESGAGGVLLSQVASFFVKEGRREPLKPKPDSLAQIPRTSFTTNSDSKPILKGPRPESEPLVVAKGL